MVTVTTYLINNLFLILIGLIATSALAVGGWAIKQTISNGKSIAASEEAMSSKADVTRVATLEQKSMSTDQTLAEIRDDVKYVRHRVDKLSDRLPPRQA